MCCLYYYDHGTIEDVERIVGKTVNSTFQGDVHPTDKVLILPEDQIKDWIHEDDMVRNFLAQPSPMLSKYQEYEQLTLW